MASKIPGKTLQTGKSMENLFQLLSRKEETLPSDAGVVETVAFVSTLVED